MPEQAPTPTRPWELAEPAIELAERWWAAAREAAEGRREDLVAAAVADPEGLTFARRFVDGVIRPEDPFVSALTLQRLAQQAPAFLTPGLRAMLRLGGLTSLAVPWAVQPIARRLLSTTIGQFLLDAPVRSAAPGRPDALGRALERVRAGGAVPVVNVLGEAVLGEQEAQRRRDAVLSVVGREDVEEVSVKLSAIASNLTAWSMRESAERLSARLTPLFERVLERVRSSGRGPVITLDMEEHRDLELTIDVFQRVLDEERFRSLPAGIVLQAYLPESVPALERLTAWARARVEDGGARIRVRLVKGANLAMERVEAVMRGWQPATLPDRTATDANFLRLLDLALDPERTGAVHVAVGTHNLYHLATAALLARERGVAEAFSAEMLLGMAPGAAAAVQKELGALRLYTPVVEPGAYSSAVSYLIRRFDELAAPGGFLAAVAGGQLEAERERFRAGLAAARDEPAPAARRRQDRSREWEPGQGGDALRRKPAPAAGDAEDGRLTEAVLGLVRGSSGQGPALAPAALPESVPVVSETGFVGEPDTDPSIEANRSWGLRILERARELEAIVRPAREEPVEPVEPEEPVEPDEQIAGQPEADAADAAEPAAATRPSAAPSAATPGLAGFDASMTLDLAAISEEAALEHRLRLVRAAARSWGARPASERAAALRRVALALAANRDRLIASMVAETGKTIAEADPEVSEAIDYARYYADRAVELESVDGAEFRPVGLTLVVPGWNFPVSIPAGGVLAALAAGSGVVLKPAPQARHTAAVLVEAIWEGGIGRDLLALADLRDAEGEPVEGELGRALVTHDDVDRVLLTGSFETAREFLSWKPEMHLIAETSGKNSIVVTPSADIDLAVADIVESAFGNAGQKCSAASVVILVGSMARNERFLGQLADAVRSLRVGPATDIATQLGPLVRPASGRLLHALTTLGVDERWLVEPRKLDQEGRLWSPGVRTGVQPGSFTHMTELFGPHLSIMHAGTLTEAIERQNAVEFGLTAGLHSLDAEEVGVWLDNVQAGNLYVNRGTTGARVERQPFGGWKRSAVGPGAKTGGPNYLWALADWAPREGTQSSTLHLRGLEDRVARVIEIAQPALSYEEFDVLRRAALGDAFVWGTEFGVVRDVSHLGIERNLLRYWPVPVVVRIAEGRPLHELLRVVIAGVLARSPMLVSSGIEVPRPLRLLLTDRGAGGVIESDEQWLERVEAMAARLSEADPTTLLDPAEPRRIRLVGDRDATARALGGSADIALWAQPVTRAGRLELMSFLREQAVSITAHRYGTPTDLTDRLF